MRCYSALTRYCFIAIQKDVLGLWKLLTGLIFKLFTRGGVEIAVNLRTAGKFFDS